MKNKKCGLKTQKSKFGIYKPMEEGNTKFNYNWKNEAAGSLETSLTC